MSAIYDIVRVRAGVYDVVVDEMVVGRIERREQVGRNTVKSYLYSGSGRHVGLWEGTVSNAALDEYDERAVRSRITRPKTTREAAAEHLLDAYAGARVALPVAEQRRRA
jgi:hypothetical protein